MPVKQERALFRKGREKGYKGKRLNSFVFGIMNAQKKDKAKK